MAKPWADKPLPLIPTPVSKLEGKPVPEAFTVATEMAQVHNIFIRLLNAIILQAPNVERPQDIADFVFFCAAVCSGVDEHHETEETFLFPLIEQHTEKGIMEQNIEQHELFHHGLRLFKTYVLQVKNGVAEYDGQHVVKLVQDFSAALTRHLTDEIDTLCELDRYDVPWSKVTERVTEHAKAHAGLYTTIPLVLSNMDVTYEGNLHRAIWPPFPWFALLMFRWMYFPRHKGAWRFASCDQYGIPQELPFA